MAPMEILQNFRTLAPRYKALLCDVWGVVHNGVEPYPGIVEALRGFRETSGPVALLTNAPRPSAVIPPQLERLGVPADCYDTIVTSGDGTRFELSKRAPAKALHLGPDRDLGLFDETGLEQTDAIEQADFILCTGLRDDTTEAPPDYIADLMAMREAGLEMVCANPDLQVMRGDQIVYCAGALALAYREIGGTVVYAGKPHKPIYDLALQRLQALDPALTKADILAVGDGPKTDVKGANQNGFDCLFIAGGLHARAFDASEARVFEATALEILQGEGVEAVAAMPGLVW